MKKVLIPWPTEEAVCEAIAEAEKQLEELREYADVDTSPIPCEEEWFKRAEDAFAVMRLEISRPSYPDFLEQAKELRMIQTPSIGFDNIDVEACTERGVTVCNVADVMSESVAQHTWGLILDVSKKISMTDRQVREGDWRRCFGIELYGKTIGIIGLGAIGGRVALKGSLAFNMRVLAYDPYVLPARAQSYNAQLVGLETLLRESDVVSVNCPLTTRTRHLLSSKELSLLKPTAILVNTGRGSVIDQRALIEALEKKIFFGAGLDVFEEEPLSKGSPLTGLENVVLTPHISSSTKLAFEKTWMGAIENIKRFVRGERPHWIVNPSSLRGGDEP